MGHREELPRRPLVGQGPDGGDRSRLLPIGSFAAATHLSLKALRLYAQLGILTPAHVDPDSGYRYYRADQVPAARLVRLMRQSDMPLALIRRILASPPDEARRLVQGYVRATEAHIVQVRRTAHDLVRILNKETFMGLEVETQDAPTQQVVSITKRVKVSELSRHIGGSLEALHGLVALQGGTPAGAPFGIFHGPVNTEEDGPLEVCIPARGAFTASGNIVVKEFPAGRLATVTVTGDACEFPAILGAYDAAYDWISANGYEPSGPPREVWLGPDGNGPMQIAWPFQEKGTPENVVVQEGTSS